MMTKTILKYTLCLILLFQYAMKTFGQQDPLYSQYMFNVQAYNPAYAGTWESIGIMTLGRYQWVGFQGAPSTYTLTVQAPMRNEKVGMGISVINDNIGFENRFATFIDYSYGLTLTNSITLRLGLKGGFTNYNNNLSAYTLYSPEGDDPSFQGDKYNNVLINFGLGTFLYSDEFYVGLSVPKILKNEIGNNKYNYEMMHLTLIGGYVFRVNQAVKFKPSFNARYVSGAPFVLDVNASFIFADRFWIGAVYRTSDAFGIGFNTNFILNDRLRIGYAYDLLNSSTMNSFNKGTHEIMVSFEIKTLKTKITSPRNF